MESPHGGAAEFRWLHPIVEGTMLLERAKKIGKKYENPVPTRVGSATDFLKVLAAFVLNREERKPHTPPGPFQTDPAAYGVRPGGGLRVTWFGHASLLLEIDGVTLLLDPVWDEFASPLSFGGPRRFFPPTLPLEHLPAIDAVLITHDHFDHLGVRTVRSLAAARPGLRWVCTLGVGAILQDFGVRGDHITELDWTEGVDVTGPDVAGPDVAAVRVTAVPSRHFSGRSAFNRFQTLWATFIVRGAQHNVYCGGDTGPWPGFADIAREYGPFDLTLLEIGAWNALWGDIHLGPEGAADAFAALGGGLLMPIHWGLFDLALHAWRQPIEELLRLATERGLRLFSPQPGLPAEPPAEGSLVAEWWR